MKKRRMEHEIFLQPNESLVWHRGMNHSLVIEQAKKAIFVFATISTFFMLWGQGLVMVSGCSTSNNSFTCARHSMPYFCVRKIENMASLYVSWLLNGFIYFSFCLQRKHRYRYHAF